MSEQRSRWCCYRCTKEVRAAVIMDGPICARCTGICQIQRTLAADQPIPKQIPLEDARASTILARAHAKGLFKLPKGQRQ
jgi:hypothetical protein